MTFAATKCSQMEEMQSDAEDGVAWALKTNKKGKYTCTDEDAQEVQQQYESFKAEVERLEALDSKLCEQSTMLTQEIEETKDKISGMDGPLMIQVK